MAKIKQKTILTGIFVILLVLVAGGIWGMLGGQPQSIIGTGSDDSGTTIVCDSSTDPDLNIGAYERHSFGALTEATNLYREVGTNTWSTFTAGTAFDVVVDAKYEVVMGISTSDTTDNAYGQYFITDNIPCKTLNIIEKEMVNDEVETSVSATFYNSDGDASAQTLLAGQSKTISLKFVSGSDEYFGNPYIEESSLTIGSSGQRPSYPNVVCLDLNTTTIKSVDKVTFDGQDMRSVSTPRIHSAVSGKVAYCYEAPVIDDTKMEQDRYFVRITTDDSTAPAIDDTAYIYASNFFVNSNTNTVGFGVEDADNNAVGADSPDSLTLDWTA